MATCKPFSALELYLETFLGFNLNSVPLWLRDHEVSVGLRNGVKRQQRGPRKNLLEQIAEKKKHDPKKRELKLFSKDLTPAHKPSSGLKRQCLPKVAKIKVIQAEAASCKVKAESTFKKKLKSACKSSAKKSVQGSSSRKSDNDSAWSLRQERGAQRGWNSSLKKKIA